jgi:hypothetical protein
VRGSRLDAAAFLACSHAIGGANIVRGSRSVR